MRRSWMLKPEPYRQRKEWKRIGLDRGLALDELGLWGNRRYSVADGMSLQPIRSTASIAFVFRLRGSFRRALRKCR